jgi:phenylacetic acid degradation operon negative regulatory protein
MKDQTKSTEWLNLLLWSLDILSNPSPAKLLESFESWDYRNRLRFELKQLRRAGLLERRESSRASPWRLSQRGRLAASGGIDPVARWSRPWDGHWRLLLFDLPARRQRLRVALWRWLKRQHFGYLQQSVWITPDAISEASIPLRPLKLTPESLTVIEGSPAPPDSNEGIVRAAWDFAAINRNYSAAIEAAVAGRQFARQGKSAEMRKWLADERAAWMTAISDDPLLPEALLPGDYLGRKAWREREITFQRLGKALNQGNK